MNIIFLQGAGGTGKSSVVKELKRMYPSGGVYTLSSSTRKTYERLGIQSETDSLVMDDETRVRLQEAVMDDWATDIQIAACQLQDEEKEFGDRLLIVDRGPFDRMAYWLLTMMECNPGSVDNYVSKMNKMIAWLDGLEADIMLFVEFPYPVAWPTQDNFRTPNELQTMALSLMISQMCFRHHQDVKAVSRYWNINEIAPAGTALDRASNMITRYSQLVDVFKESSRMPKKRGFFDRLTGR
jgi:hypothetical protein